MASRSGYGDRNAALPGRLPTSAMIFVRLLQPDGERAFPVACATEALSDASERTEQFQITRAVPRVPADNG